MIRDTISGILSYFRAMSFALKYGFVRYFIFSGIVGVMLMALVIIVAYFTSEPLTNLLLNWLSIEWLPSDILLWSVRFIIIFFFFVIFKYIYMIVLSPFMGSLSEKVNAVINGDIREKPSKLQFVNDMLRGIYLAIRNLFRELFFSLLILLLGLLIPFLSVLSPFLLFVIQAYYAGFGNLDYYMEGKYTSRESVRLVKRNKGMAIGNGIPFILLLLIPVLGVGLALPLATISGTIEMNRKGF